MNQNLEVIPLGGLGEFGMNCAVLRLGQDMILLDAGITFPGGNLTGLGIDLIVPDIEFLKENKSQLRGILLTHGHEDHAGAVSYVVDEIPAAVYGSRLTLGLVESRLRERKLVEHAQLTPIEGRGKFTVGPFEVEPLHLTHSFPDSFCFVITTSAGRIVWTGDFKFDQTPIDSKLSDVARLADYGEDGVLALFSDSTNSDVPGLAPSESAVVEPLRALFRRAPRKIVVSCFASSIHRMQVVLDLAAEFGRKVAPAGRSMISNLRVASELGYLDVPPGVLISAGEVSDHAPEKVVVLATGSQGEPMAALSRLAVNEFRKISVEEDDMIVLSARIIPGNEKYISNLCNHFYRRGAEVLDSRHSQIHASGHGFQADLKMMINLTRPRYFVPIHGEYRQLKNHADLAVRQGIPEENVRLIESGDVLRLAPGAAEVTGQVPVGRRFIDDGHRDEVDEVVVRDRRYLSEDGFMVVVLRMDRALGKIIGEPELVSRGFVLMEDSEDLMQAARDEILATIDDATLEEKRDEELFRDILRKRLQKFLRKRTGKRPVIMPVTLEI